MDNEVVISGIGIIAPNGIGQEAFLESLKKGKSGIKFIPELEKYNFSSQVGGIPDFNDEDYIDILSKYELQEADISIKYAVIAAIEAAKDAKIPIPDLECNAVNSKHGAIIGTCYGGTEIFTRKIFPYVNAGKTKRLGSQIIEHWMPSGSAATIARIFALGNQTSANSSACSTGTEAICMAYDRIKSGKANMMFAGGSDPYSPYAWAGFDSMRLLSRSYNDKAQNASRPMSITADGFVCAAGAGVLCIENKEHALKRNAKIYAEITGIAINSGGHRNNGSMTFPNSESVIACIKSAIKNAEIKSSEIDLICGHLTGTIADKSEVKNWISALDIKEKVPFINSLKSMTGHMIGAAGAAETIAAALQLKNQFIHPNINCEDLHPEIEAVWPKEKIPDTCIVNIELNYLIKAGFGFGDVNSCIVLKRYSE